MFDTDDCDSKGRTLEEAVAVAVALEEDEKEGAVNDDPFGVMLPDGG